MPRALKIAIVTLLVPISLALMVGIVFAVDRATNGGEVLGRVVVGDVPLGGLDEQDARAEVAALENRLASTPIPVEVAGEVFSLDPRAISFDLVEEEILAVALDNGRTGSLPDQFDWWMRHFSEDDLVLDLPYTYDVEALNVIIADWEIAGIDHPPFAGDVRNEDGAIVVDPPQPGTGIEREEAAEIIGTALIDLDRSPVALTARPLDPPLTLADLEGVQADAEELITGPVVLTNDDVSRRVVIPELIIRDAIVVYRNRHAYPPTFHFAWDNEPIADYVSTAASALRTSPRDAELIIEEDDTVTVVESLPVYEANLDALSVAVGDAVATGERAGDLPFAFVEEAEVSTRDILGLGITEKISEFTTYHNCCESRVINIQLIADAVDGVMVMPGETWSLNEHVGERTREKGYVPAGAIIKGEIYCCDSPINIGGGTSQFTTTLYNAIFFAGMEDISHQPHTIYFSRYPEGREATLGFPQPDLVFRNNTDAAVIIDTSHTDTSITAKFFGSNGGIEVEAGLSDRYNYTGVGRRIEYTTDVAPGEERVKAGSSGWAVNIYRYITYPDGTETTEEWTWQYRGAVEVIRRHPCSRDNTCDEY